MTSDCRKTALANQLRIIKKERKLLKVKMDKKIVTVSMVRIRMERILDTYKEQQDRLQNYDRLSSGESSGNSANTSIASINSASSSYFNDAIKMEEILNSSLSDNTHTSSPLNQSQLSSNKSVDANNSNGKLKRATKRRSASNTKATIKKSKPTDTETNEMDSSEILSDDESGNNIAKVKKTSGSKHIKKKN